MEGNKGARTPNHHHPWETLTVRDAVSIRRCISFVRNISTFNLEKNWKHHNISVKLEERVNYQTSKKRGMQ